MPDRFDVLAALGKWVFVPVLGGVVAYYVVTTLVGQSAPSTPAAPVTRDVSIDQDSGNGAAPPSDPNSDGGASPAPAPDSSDGTVEPDAIPAGITAPEVDVTVTPDQPDDHPAPRRRRHPKPSAPPKSAEPKDDPTTSDGAGDGGMTDTGTVDDGAGSDANADKPKPKPRRKRKGSKNPPTEDNGDGAANIGPGTGDGNTGNR